MNKAIALVFGVLSYLVFFGTFLYAIGFVGNIAVPKSIDSGAEAPAITALVINLVLLTIFALQHSVMARPGFKRVWTKVVPKVVERSVYVLLASSALILLFWQWRPMTGVIWDVENSFGRIALLGTFAAGWLIVLLSTFMINHFDLFGLRQVYLYSKSIEPAEMDFKTRFFYNFVRHPIMLGFIIAFWATPTMTVGHLLFAAVTTAYILVAIQFEERDLVNAHGETYKAYKREVGMLIPTSIRAGGQATASSHEVAGS
ncbi:MAG TPA: NnrU family protein [Pyrinomonadaceae bacterium]|nr:NnrU family protein [Pyrinomonadaceae bacterium]